MSRDCRVYVGNLSYETRWQGLKDFMREAGEVVHADVLMLANGRSKGCGVVEYSSPEEAARAIETLSNRELDGRQVFVREDRETAAPPAGQSQSQSQSGSSGSGGSQGGQTGVFITNLPYTTTWQDLKDAFRGAGHVVRADVHSSGGRSRGTGTVVFQTEDEAREAIDRYNGTELQGRVVEVRLDRFAGSTGGSFGGSSSSSSGADSLTRSVFSSMGPNGTTGNYLFVSNLPWETTAKDLEELFQTVSPVKQADVHKYTSGRARGTGVVEFGADADVQEAILRLNGYLYGGRELSLSVARAL